jgi:hypothetical protein
VSYSLAAKNMTKKKWAIIIAINLLAMVLILLPFLPGPAWLYYPAQFFFQSAQICAPFALFALPIGLIWAYLGVRRHDKAKHVRLIAMLLSTIPITIYLSSIYLDDLARDLSRKIAISHAKNLISAIEHYKLMQGVYPNNFSDLIPTYLKSIPATCIIGIPGYAYRKSEQSYRIVFTQNVLLGFNFEVVEYSPIDDQKAEGTYKTLYRCGQPHWKYYIYD